jgi:hypothetical protein
MLKKTSGGSSRRLQQDIPCAEMDDGSVGCVLEDYPGDGLNAVISCPASASTLSDCSACAIVSDDTTDQCNSCTVCSDATVAFDCSNIAEGDCISMDCSGNCEGSTTDTTPTTGPTEQTPTETVPPQPTDTVPPPDDEMLCSEMADGSLTCREEDYPGEDFHVDFSCPDSASTMSDCSSCKIVSDDNTTQCNSCTICADMVAYDCSNIAEGDCVSMDCSGNCQSSDETTPAPGPPEPTTDNDSTPAPTMLPPGRNDTSAGDPTSSASVMETSTIIISATAIVVFGLI